MLALYAARVVLPDSLRIFSDKELTTSVIQSLTLKSLTPQEIYSSELNQAFAVSEVVPIRHQCIQIGKGPRLRPVKIQRHRNGTAVTARLLVKDVMLLCCNGVRLLHRC